MMENDNALGTEQLLDDPSPPRDATKYDGRAYGRTAGFAILSVDAEWPDGSPIYSQEIRVLQDYLSIEIDDILPSSCVAHNFR